MKCWNGNVARSSYRLYCSNGKVARVTVLSALLEGQFCESDGTDSTVGTAMLLDRVY
jgi:hypothetical protein